MKSEYQVVPAFRTDNITYAVRDVVVLADKIAKQGKDMLYLNIGDPNKFDFRTPDHIIEAAYKALKDNQNGYSPSSGIKEGLDSIRREAERKGIRNIQDIFITTGASEAIEICLTALVNRGENVLTPSPGYPLYTAIISKLEADENPYYLDESNGWQPDLEDIKAKINAKTRAIVLINPNNPTGSNCSRELLIGLIDLAVKHNLVIFSDEIYDKLLFDGEKHIATASLNDETPIITFGGLSKNYLGPGLWIGWGIISGKGSRLVDYIEAVNKILRARLCANHPLQYAIKPALDGPQDHIVEMMAKLTVRRDISVEMLNNIEGISCVTPKGAFYAFPRLQIDGDDLTWVQELLKATGVVVVHGSGFGQIPGTKHFRVVFLPPEEKLKRAYQQIANFMADYK